jgi:putative endonuclease
MCYFINTWGCSSVGRALEWHSRGRGFDPLQLHQFSVLTMSFSVYILKNKAGFSYVGHTSDLDKRLFEHNSGKSLSTKNRRPWQLVYKEEYQTRSEAASRERHFKSVAGRMELKARGIL